MTLESPFRSPARRRLAAAALIAATVCAGVGLRVAAHESSPQPPPDVVRPAGSGGPVDVEARLDRHSVLAGSDGLVRLELTLRGREIGRLAAQERPTDLVVVLDRSGSMSGEPMHFARSAVQELISQLGRGDRFALVSYAHGARVDVPLEHADAATRTRWHRALAAIVATGGTNMASGLDAAHALISGSRQAGRVPRMVLLSDGHANEGDHSLEGLRARARRAVGGEYVLSAVGIGQGFDEALMSAVADAGTGNFYYLPHLRKLAGVFADEFASARQTVASALAVAFHPGDGVAVRGAAGYPLERDGSRVVFRPGDLFAGQERRVWLTLAAPTAQSGPVDLGRLDVSFADATGVRQAIVLEPLPELACAEREDDYYASFDADVYRRGFAEEALGALKQKIAGQMSAGRLAAAKDDVAHFLAEMKKEQVRALGGVSEADLGEAEALRDAVAAPEAASPAVQNQMGKALLEEGRDTRRSGSKRH